MNKIQRQNAVECNVIYCRVISLKPNNSRPIAVLGLVHETLLLPSSCPAPRLLLLLFLFVARDSVPSARGRLQHKTIARGEMRAVAAGQSHALAGLREGGRGGGGSRFIHPLIYTNLLVGRLANPHNHLSLD